MHANQFAEFQDRLEQKAAEVADTLRDRRLSPPSACPMSSMNGRWPPP